MNEKEDQESSDMMVAMILEAFVVENEVEWWTDSSVMSHITSNRNAFQTFELVGVGMNFFMGNFSTSKVVGKGTVKLKFTSGKVITL